MSAAEATAISLPAGVRLLDRLRRTPVIPILTGALLLVAALLKAHQAAAEEFSERNLLTTRWFLTCTVSFELALGLWLISGLHESLARWAAVAALVVFFETSLYLHALNAPSCGCFGRIAILPWQAALIDLAFLGLLLVWRPADGLRILTHRRWSCWLAGAYVCVTAPVIISVLDYAPRGPMAALRHDVRLAATVPLHFRNGTAPDILEELHKVTDLTFTLAKSVEPARALGEVQTDRARAWAVLEWLAIAHPLPTRWDRTDHGYELVRAAPLGVTFPWVMAGLVLVATSSAAVLIRKRQQA